MRLQIDKTAAFNGATANAASIIHKLAHGNTASMASRLSIKIEKILRQIGGVSFAYASNFLKLSAKAGTSFFVAGTCRSLVVCDDVGSFLQLRLNTLDFLKLLGKLRKLSVKLLATLCKTAHLLGMGLDAAIIATSVVDKLLRMTLLVGKHAVFSGKSRDLGFCALLQSLNLVCLFIQCFMFCRKDGHLGYLRQLGKLLLGANSIHICCLQFQKQVQILVSNLHVFPIR